MQHRMNAREFALDRRINARIKLRAMLFLLIVSGCAIFGSVTIAHRVSTDIRWVVGKLTHVPSPR